ncbi:hypothetical protein AX16_002932 [Volvariella volvacea WC 439]|nr:hypothetical protein AX16_002932 [Volvariella volvacea WC 439]
MNTLRSHYLKRSNALGSPSSFLATTSSIKAGLLPIRSFISCHQAFSSGGHYPARVRHNPLLKLLANMTTRPISTITRIAARSSSVPPPIVTTNPKRREFLSYPGHAPQVLTVPCDPVVHESRAQHAIRMPVMSPFLTECTIRRWAKKEGEPFYPGDVLLQIESDIATIDVPAENAGIIAKILVRHPAPTRHHCAEHHEQIPDGTTVPFEQIIALVARDSQEYARLRAQTQLQSPPTPPAFTPSTLSPRRSSSPPPYDQPVSPSTPTSSTSSPRTPVTRRSPFRYQTHITTSPSPPPPIHNTAGAVRGMVTNHVRSMTLPGPSSPSSSSMPRSFIPSPRRNTISFSTTTNSTNISTGQNTLRSRASRESFLISEDQWKQELDGPSIRRIIVNNLSRNSPEEQSPQEYFEGIL